MCYFFFKEKTAYEVRISDWSSDVCSSDLAERVDDRGKRGARWKVARCAPRIIVGTVALQRQQQIVHETLEIAVVAFEREPGDPDCRRIEAVAPLRQQARFAVARGRMDERQAIVEDALQPAKQDRKSTRLNSSH